MSKIKSVLIEWVDSHSGRGWQSIDELSESCQYLYCKTIGYVVSETDKNITVAGTIYDEDKMDWGIHALGDITIPKCAIKKRKTIKP